ncbi:hypothetical protein ACHEXK_09800 [Limnohabitans sp. DCL3]|uniref:hypothetical protein n=1 Tax=Limnohabitans sp. DCL3 TaxID=3374103 RepID=UPI003A83E624
MLKSKLYYYLMLPFFFPNVGFNLFSFDVSPFPMISALIILSIESKNYPKILYYLWIPAFFSFPIILMTYEDWPYFVRLIGVYFSVPLISIACYKSICSGVDVGKLSKNVIYISFIAGLAQKFISTDVFSNLLHSRSTESRGYSSLYSEPSFFGMATLMFLLIYIISNIKIGKRCDWKPLFVGLLSIFMLSQSAISILILLVVSLLYCLLDLNRRNIIILIFWAVLLVMVLSLVVEETGSRTLNIINMFINSPQDILLIDASISERVMHIYLSIKGSINNYFMPSGFYKFIEIINNEMLVNEFFWWGESTNKIMSGIGSALFEIGIISLITPLVFISLAYKNNFNFNMLVLTSLLPILIYANAINFASPYFSILIGLLAFNLRGVDSKIFVKKF